MGSVCKECFIFRGIETLTGSDLQRAHHKIVRDKGIFVPDTPRFPVSVDTFYQLNTRLVNLTVADEHGVETVAECLSDALLSVTAANTALPWDTWHDTTYTSIYSCVDWPGISLQLGLTVDKNIDQKYSNFGPFSKEDARLESLYDPEAFHGLPLSLRLAARKFEDEKLLAIAELLHPVMKGVIPRAANADRSTLIEDYAKSESSSRIPISWSSCMRGQTCLLERATITNKSI
ncbi:hypothetical protein J3459_010912 [Metarhizium acridum]|nr:hypothetical protein J3459_010912 [Metarhizium acridum]